MSKKKKESYDLSSLSRKRYSISNNLINAKGKTTALAEKLFHIGIHQAELEEGTEQLVVTLHGTELRELFGDKGTKNNTVFHNVLDSHCPGFWPFFV